MPTIKTSCVQGSKSGENYLRTFSLPSLISLLLSNDMGVGVIHGADRRYRRSANQPAEAWEAFCAQWCWSQLWSWMVENVNTYKPPKTTFRFLQALRVFIFNFNLFLFAIFSFQKPPQSLPSNLQKPSPNLPKHFWKTCQKHPHFFLRGGGGGSCTNT